MHCSFYLRCSKETFNGFGSKGCTIRMNLAEVVHTAFALIWCHRPEESHWIDTSIRSSKWGLCGKVYCPCRFSLEDGMRSPLVASVIGHLGREGNALLRRKIQQMYLHRCIDQCKLWSY